MRAANGLSFNSNSVQLRSGRQTPVGSAAAAAAKKDVDELLAHDAIAMRPRRWRAAPA